MENAEPSLIAARFCVTQPNILFDTNFTSSVVSRQAWNPP